MNLCVTNELVRIQRLVARSILEGKENRFFHFNDPNVGFAISRTILHVGKSTFALESVSMEPKMELLGVFRNRIAAKS
jgi:hypothetical protein